MSIYKHKNQDFTFNNIYYVSTTGLDTNDGLTIDTAFLTCGKAANVAQTGDAIVFDKGRFCITYDLGSTGAGRGGLSDYGKSITFFGQDINTILYNNPNLMTSYRDMHIASLYGINSKVYNCVFEHDAGQARIQTSYASALLGSNASVCYGKFYNCVFKCINNFSNYPTIIYDNSETGDVRFFSCAFIMPSNIVNQYSGGNSIKEYDKCAFNVTKTGNGPSTGYLEYQDIDLSLYRNLTNSNYGVYSGNFSWATSKLLFMDESLNLYKYNSGLISLNKQFPPNMNDFSEFGISELPNITEIPSNYKILGYSLFQTLTKVNVKPKDVICKLALLTPDVINFDTFTLTSNINNNSILKFLISTDGNNYFKFDNTNWVNTSLSNISNEGMTLSELNNINTGLNNLVFSNDKQLFLAVYMKLDNFTDTLNLDKIEIQVDLCGKWEILDQFTNSTQNYYFKFAAGDKLTSNLYLPGTYKINF